MTHEFDRVRDAFASSLGGRTISALDDAISRAWRSSAFGNVARTLDQAIRTAPAASSIRAAGITVVAAAVIQPLLISAMPPTVVPAVPSWTYALIAAFAAAAAWQADAISAAWRSSRLRRLIRR